MNTVKPGYVRPLDLRNGRVDFGFGAGGRAMAQLISELFARAFANDYLARGDDGAEIVTIVADGHAVMECPNCGRAFPPLRAGQAKELLSL